MNKLFSKIAALSVGLAMAVGVGVALGHEGVKEVRADDVLIDLTAKGYTNQQAITTVEQDGFTLTFAKASGSNDPKYYTSGTSVRTYASNTLTVATSGSDDIVEIVFTLGGTTTAVPTVNVGSYNSSTKTWTGEAKSVVFTNASSGQYHYKKVSITTGSATVKYTVSFDANGGSGSMESQKIEENAKYPLPANGFTAPANKAFKCWSVGGTERAVGYELTVVEDVTVSAVWKDITREDLPEGTYEVEVSYAGRTSVPESGEYFDIKQPVGDVYYKQMKVEYSNVTRSYANEYTMTKNTNSTITVTSESNATIESVTIDFYQYVNAVIVVGGTTVTEPISGKGDDHRSFTADIKSSSFTILNNTSFNQSLWGFTVSLKVSSVPDPVVNFDSFESSLVVGDTGTFTATSEHATNPSYSWASSNGEVLSIDASSGEYEALQVGKATITVTLTCTEGSATKSASVNVAPDHTLTIAEAIGIAESLDGDAQETTEYFAKVRGYIISLDADTKTRAFNLSDVKVGVEGGNSIMAYGIYSSDPLRNYAILNGLVEFNCHIQNYKGTLELKDLTLVSYSDAAMTYAKSAYESLDETCVAGAGAVTDEQWTGLASDFAALDEYARAKLAEASSSYEFSEDIARWVGRYGIIVASGRTNFMENATVSSNYLYGNNTENSSYIIIIVISAVSVMSFGLALFLRKKRSK